MKTHLWTVYGVLAAGVMVVYFSVGGEAAKLAVLVPFEVATAATVVLAARLHGVPRLLPWGLVAAGLLSFAVGDAILYGYPVLVSDEVPFPYWYDVFYLGCYGFLGAALASLVRARCGRERASLLDALILTTGLGLPVWLLLVQPYLRDDEVGLAAQLVAVAYPLADLVVLAMLARLWFSPGPKPVAFALLVGGTVPLLVSDVFFCLQTLSGTWSTGTPVDAGWILWLSLWGMAAAHPSLALVSEPGRGAARLSRSRAAALAVAGLVAPSVLLAQGLGGGPVDAGPIAVAFVLLTVLVTARVAGLVQDLTASVSRQRGQERFRALVQGGSDLITLVRADGLVTYQSPSSERVLGLAPDELEGRPLGDLVHPDDRPRLASHTAAVLAGQAPPSVELRLRAHDGTWRWVETLGGAVIQDRSEGRDGDPEELSLVLTSRDVTERHLLSEQLTRQALHDPLTGLPNRRLFADRVQQALARRGDLDAAVLYVDLDDFKSVNDTLGHAAGDALLIEVARRLTSAVRTGDSVARLGGDEFAVLLEDDVEPDTGAVIAERVVRLLQSPVRVGDTELVPGASVGVATASSGTDPDDLLRSADLAMYMAKGSGKGGYQVFRPEMYAATVDRLELVADLRRAVDRGELRLHFQPTVHIGSGSVSGVEALVRWEHPTRGLLGPGTFIPLAEETGLIVPMTRWILAAACREAAAWPVPVGGRPVGLAVNLSPRHLTDPAVVDDVALALAESGLEPGRLLLEITETGLLSDESEMVETMHRLKELGVRLAVDDFGTGYSSLSYLRRFPIDVLKVDKSFVDGLGLEGEATALVRAILEMARTMNMTTVAEGIEVGQQLTELAALGCDLGQGFLLSRPLTPDRLLQLLADPEGASRELTAPA